MQPKTVLIASISLICACLLGWILWNGGDSASVAEWGQEDVVAISEEDLAAQVQADELDSLQRDEVEGEEGDNGSDEVRPMVIIRGRVINKLSAPVGGAKVALSAQGRGRRSRVSLDVVTKSDGTFAFSGKGFTRMWVTLEVTHQDYATASAFKPFDDAEGELDMGDIQVMVGGTIIGSITDMQGNLVQDATARLRSTDRRGGFRGFGRGSRRGSQLPEVKADANGVFRMEHVPPGRVQVTASAPRRQRASKGPITIVDAQEERLDPIQLGPGFQLTGIVFMPDGKVLEDAEVRVRGGRTREEDDTNKRGEFAFDHLPPGEYRVEVQAKGYLTNKEHTGIQVTEAGPLSITMKPGLHILGVVTDAATGLPVTKYAARARRIRSLPNPEADRQRAEANQIRDQFRELMAIGDKRTPAQQAEMDKLLGKIHESGSQGGGFFRGGSGRGDRGSDRGGSGRGDRGSDRGGSGRGDRGSDRGRRGGDRSSDRGRRGRTNSFDFGRRSNNSLPGDTGDVEPHPEGKFDFDGLEEGIYVVDIGSPAHEKIRSQQIELREGIDPVPLALVVKRGITLAGLVTSKKDQLPINNVEIELRLILETNPQDASARQGSRSRGDRGRGGMDFFRSQESGPRTTGIMTVRTTSDGTFEFKNAPGGRYLIRAEAEDYAKVSTDPFELSSDRTDVSITLGSLAVIEGRVSGIPIGKVTETRVMAFSRPRTMKDAKVHEDGTYEITGLEAGDYIVRAFIGDSRRFIFREMFRGMSRTEAANNQTPEVDVQVKEGGHHRFNVALTQNLTGSVVGLVMVNGKGAQGYRVSLRKIEQDTGQQTNSRGNRFGGMFGRGGSATVDQNGEFEIKGVEIGEYTVSISSGSGSSRSRWSSSEPISRHRIFVSAEQATSVPVVTINYGSLLGTVTLPEEESTENKAAENTGQQAASTATGGASNANRRSSRSGGRVSLYKGVTEVPDPGLSTGADVLRFSARLRDNKFEFKELPAGDYLIQIRLSGRESVTKTVYVASGSKTPIEIVAGKTRTAGPQGNPPPPGGNLPGSKGAKGSKGGKGGKGAKGSKGSGF
ncbi:MAG: carboxypeptidase-like regulatory domain-containing protein [Planctomycetota bacterium]|nr:carboxypeptidase-like regulatory domain-containing protein [Planctomycetota bacterium]